MDYKHLVDDIFRSLQAERKHLPIKEVSDRVPKHVIKTDQLTSDMEPELR